MGVACEEREHTRHYVETLEGGANVKICECMLMGKTKHMFALDPQRFQQATKDVFHRLN